MDDFQLVNQLHDIGISDEKIANRCNVSRQFICNVRNGKKKAGAELHNKLQELYNAANQRGLLDTYTPVTHAPVVESVPVTAPVPYEPYVARPILHSPQPQPQPEKPLDWFEKRSLEKQARIAARQQAHTGNTQPVQPVKPKKPMLLPLRVRIRQAKEYGRACEQARRNGLPMPPYPSDYEETPITETPKHQTPEPKRIETPVQQTAMPVYQAFDTYRNTAW